MSTCFHKLLLLCSCFIGGSLYLPAQEFAGGTGSSTDPFLISTAQHLDNVRNYLAPSKTGTHFLMINDIDLTDFLKGKPAGWEPIGNFFSLPTEDTCHFKGTFRGGGHRIKGLFINRPGNAFVGLFGAVSESTIENLTVEIAEGKSITGNDWVGGLIGESKSSTVTGCAVYGKVVARNHDAGGLIGSMVQGGLVSKCFAEVEVEGAFQAAGLIAGIILSNSNSNNKAEIRECYARGTVSCQLVAGGLIAQFSGILSDCYAEVNIKGRAYVGGLVALPTSVNEKAVVNSIQNCYSTGRVEGNTSAGGIGGESDATFIAHCIAANASVTGTTEAHRIIGGDNIYDSSPNTFTNNYAYSGLLVNGGRVTGGQANDVNGLDKTAKELYTQKTYEDLGWNFDSIWEMPPTSNNPCAVSLPVFQWQTNKEPVLIQGVETGLMGTYTIGLQDSGLTNFPTFDNLQQTLNACRIIGDVTFLVAAGTHTLNSALVFPPSIAQGRYKLRLEGMTGGATLKTAGAGYRHISIADTLHTIISNLHLQHNPAVSGGGIEYTAGADTLALHALHISGCKADGSGGAVLLVHPANSTQVGIVDDCTFAGNFALHGGAVYSSRQLWITRSTFINNRSGGRGGAICGDDQILITNSTFSGNGAEESGGAIAADNPAVLFSTIMNNHAGGEGGGVWAGSASSVRGSVIIGNTAPAAPNSNSSDYTTEDYYNLHDDNASLNDIFGTPAPVLANNGGVTETFMIKAYGKADNQIPETAMLSWETVSGQADRLRRDQCGRTRPQNKLADIGAVEILSAAKLDTLTASNQTLSPVFNPDTVAYMAKIKCGENGMELCFRTSGGNTVHIDGREYACEDCFTVIPGVPGSRQPVSIEVENGATQILYVVSVETPFANNIIYQAYDNMIEVVANPSINGGYSFLRNAYQWYTDSNGQPIAGKTSGVLYFPEGFAAGESYSVDATVAGDGSVRHICGLVPQKVSAPLKVYPNPVTSTLHIETGTTALKEKIEIYSITGMLLGTYQATGGHTQIDLSAFSSGIYLLKLKGETVKIIKK